MRTCRVPTLHLGRITLGAVFATVVFSQPIPAQDKPTGAPLVLSSIETEQEVPLAILLPDGKTAKCVPIRLHWNSQPDIRPNDDAAGFTLDLPADNPAAPAFTAQLWNASLAGALAWQEPWEGARWKVLQTPVTDGTGIDAALAVGMISTSARRPYPARTVVIGSLNPDGSLGPVSHLVERLDAAAQAGMTRVIIPSVQRFDTDASGQVVNMVRRAGDLHLECVPVDDLVAATQTVMNDPLPEMALDASVPKYSNEVASYIDDFARHEQSEAAGGLKYAPKESDLAGYPPHLANLAAIWKSVYADVDAGRQAYRAGQVYAAYRLFSRANGHMNGANALAGQTRISFDVKAALAESDDLHDHLRLLMSPPSVDQGSLESAVLVAEMTDWAYDINASLEGAQLITKQAFSQRSDATEAEKDRAREAILFANEQGKYLLTQADFYTGLLPRISKENPVTADENAAHLLPQLIPAQLATARRFTDGIRSGDLRDGLLFDPRLVAYVNVLRQSKADWDAHQRKKENQPDATAPAVPAAGTVPGAGPVKLDANAPESAVGFNPNDTYRPPHTAVAPAVEAKKLSDVAQCLIWVDHDCEIATLDEKYLRLNGTMDSSTHEWHVKDRGKLDALLQMAEMGARRGIAFGEKAAIDPSVLVMIYERAAHQRLQGDDASALAALRNYWRCALLGDVCWQLAHTPKAQPVELGSAPAAGGNDKTAQKEGTKTGRPAAQADDTVKRAPTTSTNVVVTVGRPGAEVATHDVVTPIVPAAITNTVVPVNPPAVPVATPRTVSPPPAVVEDPPVVPIATPEIVSPPPAVKSPTVVEAPPVAPIATNEDAHSAPPMVNTRATNSVSPVPSPTAITANNDIPVAPIAKAQDYTGGDGPPATNAPSVTGPIPPSNKPDAGGGHAGEFP